MRTIATELVNLMKTGKYAKRNMVQFNVSTGNYGFWTDVYDFTYGGVTFSGVGDSMIISNIDYSSELVIRDLVVTFNPMLPLLISEIESAVYIRKPAFVYQAYIDVNTSLIVGVLQLFSGIIGHADYTKHSKNQATAVINLESNNWDLGVSGAGVRNASDQRRIVAGDTGFDFTGSAVAEKIWWGRHGPQRPTRR